eukprot:4805210-Prymnesium_polylepis.2
MPAAHVWHIGPAGATRSRQLPGHGSVCPIEKVAILECHGQSHSCHPWVDRQELFPRYTSAPVPMTLGGPNSRRCRCAAGVEYDRLCGPGAHARLRLFAVCAPNARDLADVHGLYLEAARGPAIAEQVPLHPVVQCEAQPRVVAQRARCLVCDRLGRHRQ